MSYLNPNQSWWQASFCLSNIVVAIGSTVLVTHASLLQSAKDLCFAELPCLELDQGTSNASCTVQDSLTLTKTLLLVYSLGLGLHSLFWIIYLCCQGQKRFVKIEERQVDRSMLQLVMNILGCILTLTNLVSLAIYTTHVQLLLPSMEFKSDTITSILAVKVQHHNFEATEIQPISVCHEVFSSISWNVISIIILIICFIFHAGVVGYIVMNYVAKKKANVPEINVAFVAPDFDLQPTRVRIPSSRTYPSSPITFKPLTISPLPSGNKFGF